MPYLSFSDIAQRLFALSAVVIAAAVLVTPAHAACTGSSPNLIAPTWADVRACHDLASSGDTITVTAGSYTATANTTITKWVKIVAGGAVTVTDNTCSGLCFSGPGDSMITITESSAGNTRLQGFTFNQGTAIHNNPSAVVYVAIGSSGKPVVLYGNDFHTASTTDDVLAVGNDDSLIHWQPNRGIISHNHATGPISNTSACFNNSQFVQSGTGGTIQSGEWSTPIYVGANDTNGDQNLYVEDNIINTFQVSLDLVANGRVVFRHNTVTNSGNGIHGITFNNGRFVDFYGNTFIRDKTLLSICGNLPYNMTSFMRIGGGTVLIHGNSIPDPSTVGIWGSKSAVIFSNDYLHYNEGAWACYATTTCPSCGYPSPQQPGWGFTTGGKHVCVGCTSGGQPTDIYQDLQPIYVWGNTGTGNYDNPSLLDAVPNNCGAMAPSVSTYVMEGREYYLNADAPSGAPGYTPYTYPHPLTAGNSGPTVSISITQ
jgi:hypothetical protein